MARPRKSGLDYFPFDIDFFEDEKVVAVAGEFGIKGEIVAIRLLCAIYRNGYFIEWTEMLRLKMLRQMPGISAELFDQILNRLVRWGFFDASLFNSVKVLTSTGIQRRYFSIIKRRLKGQDYPYLLVSDAETPVSVDRNSVNDDRNPQSKEKKSKIKKSPDGDKKGGEGQQGTFDFKEKKKGQRKAKESHDPTLDEVLKYFESHPDRPAEWDLQARLFFSHYDSMGWKNVYGNKVERWDSKANYWILEKKKHSNETKQPDRLSEFRGTESSATSRKGFKGTF